MIEAYDQLFLSLVDSEWLMATAAKYAKKLSGPWPQKARLFAFTTVSFITSPTK
jgi:hypothetical protein